MLTFKQSMDTKSLDIYRECTKSLDMYRGLTFVGFLQWHEVPNIKIYGINYLLISELEQILNKYKELKL